MKFSFRFKIRRFVLAAAVLLAFHLDGSPSIHAESGVVVQDYLLDASKGIELYSISSAPDGTYRKSVIYRQQDGAYAKWQEPFRSFSVWEDGTVRIGGSDDPEGGYVYDPERQSILHKNIYSLSPDGNWGILERSRYLYVSSPGLYSDYIAKLNDYYLKNMKTGAVKLFKSTRTSYLTAWVDRHTLLESGYDSRAKQNMITAYNPETNQRTTVLAGSMYAFNNASSKLLYVQNEPRRLLRVYDLKKASSHLLKDEAERSAIYPSVLSKPKLSLPDGISPDNLPVVPVPVIEEYEYTAGINGLSIPVSTVFEVNGTRWIPVRPLAKALGWKVDLLDQPAGTYKAANYQYTISKGAAKIVLTPSNSFNTGGRLFMTKGQLGSLGLGSVKLVPHIE
ncbi:hypothetical protein [Paenibacillus sp. URB8-2]|uniref:hypothetical protein n=1 Tax=Paenibacillus sp. URB8-2 TaxID=2741301 RepID=UPI0015BC34C9|nr:hypothetical protein [Paenibacillus sp. URB8-2]BCG59986.1 hypothetical protein PUR_34110 [Paenibacillus sp. URB8-2]